VSTAIPERPDPDAGAGHAPGDGHAPSGAEPPSTPTPAEPSAFGESAGAPVPAFPPPSPFASPPRGAFGGALDGRALDGRMLDGGHAIGGHGVEGQAGDQGAFGPIPGPWPVEPEPPKGPLDTAAARALVALGVAIFVALLGFPLGWLWESVVPRVPVVRQGQDFFYADPYGEQRAAQEGWFILLSIGVGLVLAIACWVLLRRFRGAPMTLALGLGGAVAGWLTWRFGHAIGYAHSLALQHAAKDGQTVYLPPDLRIKQKGDIAFWHHLPYISGDLLYLSIAALVTYLLLASFTANPDLRPRRRARGPQAPETPPSAA
jgi:hypothetical protein